MNDKKKDNDKSRPGLISEMVIEDKKDRNDPAGLLVEPQEEIESDDFEKQLQITLKETEKGVLSLKNVADTPDQTRSWQNARKVVEEFKPVPWFIWRLCNFVLGKPGKINQVSEGLVFGLRRLMFAAASDSVLGSGEKVNNARKALKILKPDTIAAVAVIHAICRRLSSRQFERIWRPILDDAILRARIGYMVAEKLEGFGSGRGMLAGFAGRCGLAITITSGDLDQARAALEMLATGTDIKEVGLAVYDCEPLQVSAMTLSAAGCGRDAAFGTVSYASEEPESVISNDEQKNWLIAFSVIEKVRMGLGEQVPDEYWTWLGFNSEAERALLLDEARTITRRGHEWKWLG
ncbi:MAG: hypothetical protein D6719_12590 [Candidatus Dadabacteria bacterium]|nr:MAG: hypothetical protein D6719_12590 [Candidatus Dadabacteria bacterium]